MDPYQKLADAIILRAVNDYRKLQRAYRQNPNDSDIQMRMKELELFFCSKWYAMLTNLNSEHLMRLLNAEVNA